MSLYDSRMALCSNCGGISPTVTIYHRNRRTEREEAPGCQHCRAPLGDNDVQAYRELQAQRREQARGQATHFVYVCRTCKQEVLEKITWPDHAATPVPTCCTSKKRDMAFVAMRTVPDSQEEA